MLSLDLFDSRYEKQLHEGALDDTITRTQAHLMEPLSQRAADIRTQIRNRKLSGADLDKLEKEYEDLVQQRQDIIFNRKTKTQEQQVPSKQDPFAYVKPEPKGIPGNVPTKKIPGKDELLKGRGRTYYENQKKNTEQVDEYISMGSDKNFVEADPYKNYRIYVRKKPFGTTGMYTAHTEIDRKEFMGKGPSQEEAVQDIRDRIDFVLNAQRKVTGSSTIDFNVKFATDLLADPKQTFYAKLENINGEPKLVIASADVASDPELLAAGDFKRSALRNQPDDQGRATPLPGIPLTAKGLRSGDWIANGRYTVGKETQDRDGNRVFDLTYHSTAHTKSDKLRLNQPAFTLGTAREVDEHGGGIGPRQHWQDLMQEGQPLELMNRYLAIDAENDVDAVRQAIQAISKDPNVSDASKTRLLGQLGMIIRRYRLPIGRAYYQFMQQYMEEQSVNETVTDVRPLWADVYRRLAPKIERHRDSFLAGQLYDELENIAELHGAEGEFKRMMNGARNRAHMEYDTNPGGFQNWFWFLPFEDEQLDEIDRRGFLKGLGATAGLAAMGGAKAATSPDDPSWRKVGQPFDNSVTTSDQVKQVAGQQPTLSSRIANVKGPNAKGEYLVTVIHDDDIVSNYVTKTPPKSWMQGTHKAYPQVEGMTEGTDDVKKRMSKLEALALAANRAGDDAKCKMYQQKIQSLKQKLSQSMAEGWSDQGNPTAYSVYIDGREWRAYKSDDHARAVAEKVRANLKRQGRDQTVTIAPSKAKRVQENISREPRTARERDDMIDKIRRMMALDRDPANLQIMKKDIEILQTKYRDLKEDSGSGEAVEMAIMRRMLVAHTDLIVEFGLDKVVAAIEEVAYDIGDVDEIGSSDVSGWVLQVERILGADA